MVLSGINFCWQYAEMGGWLVILMYQVLTHITTIQFNTQSISKKCVQCGGFLCFEHGIRKNITVWIVHRSDYKQSKKFWIWMHNHHRCETRGWALSMESKEQHDVGGDLDIFILWSMLFDQVRFFGGAIYTVKLFVVTSTPGTFWWVKERANSYEKPVNWVPSGMSLQEMDWWTWVSDLQLAGDFLGDDVNQMHWRVLYPDGQRVCYWKKRQRLRTQDDSHRFRMGL